MQELTRASNFRNAAQWKIWPPRRRLGFSSTYLKMGMPCIPTDAIKHGLINGIPNFDWDDTVPFMQNAQKFKPFLMGIALNAAGAWPDIAVEGHVVLPKYANSLRKRLTQTSNKRQKAIDVSACFLGWSEISVETIIRYEGTNCWFSNSPAEHQENTVKWIIKFSRYIERECNKYAFPYVDMSVGNYKLQQRLALETLMGHQKDNRP